MTLVKIPHAVPLRENEIRGALGVRRALIFGALGRRHARRPDKVEQGRIGSEQGFDIPSEDCAIGRRDRSEQRRDPFDGFQRGQQRAVQVLGAIGGHAAEMRVDAAVLDAPGDDRLTDRKRDANNRDCHGGSDSHESGLGV